MAMAHRFIQTGLRAGLVPAVLLASAATACAQSAGAGLASTKGLAPETALAAAQAAMAQCRRQGYQVSVAVVDRDGLTQVLLRDRYAGAHTLDFAVRKAWTAASFKMPTAVLAEQTQAGKAMSGIRADIQVMAVAGGLPLEAGGATLGGIGVSGAPGGDADEACSQAGLHAIVEALEF